MQLLFYFYFDKLSTTLKDSALVFHLCIDRNNYTTQSSSKTFKFT